MAWVVGGLGTLGREEGGHVSSVDVVGEVEGVDWSRVHFICRMCTINY